MRKNLLKEKILSGKPVIGSFVNLPCPEIVEMAGLVGYDFVIIDCEHGPMDLETTYHLLRAAEAVNVPTVIRCAQNVPQVILRYLDSGAGGVMVPQIRTLEDAKQLVSSVKFQPIGWRGLAATRAANYGVTMPVSEYVQQANRETMIVMQIETKEAVESLDDLLKIEGIDVYFLGPSDLSQSLGLPGQTSDPRVQELIANCTRKIRAAGKAVGTTALTPESASKSIEMGIQYITVAPGMLFINASRQFLGPLKGR